MSTVIKSVFLFASLIFSAQMALAQYMASAYQPKCQTEKLVIAKIRALPEVKDFFKYAKNSMPDMVIDRPDSSNNWYSFQVGLSNLDIFRTQYWLYIDPKTFKIYYWDQLNEMDDPIITLEQWRYWRTKPGFKELHSYKNGKLIVSQTEHHDKKKSSRAQ